MKSLPVLTSVLAAIGFQAVAAEKKPNILLIVADDLGYGELGVQGFSKDIPTPNIDSIANNGVRFTNGYVSGPYCSPTRAGLLTGRYQQRFGHEFNPGPVAAGEGGPGLSLTETTFGDRLKSAGYTTGWFGKSHLGNSAEYHPLKRGFDEFYGFLGGAHSYVNGGADSNNPILRGTEVVKDPGYLTEDFAKEAASFIERKKDTPWFVYLPFNAVHAPLETLEKYESRFASIKDEKRRKFAGLLSALDDSVGSVLGKVRDLGLEENTLIYFISDNGGPTASITSGNGPLRGFKAQTWEGGIRVPFAIQWKGKLPAGKVESRPAIQLDFLPTSLAAAGVEINPEWKLDGVNLLPYLTGGNAADPHEALYWRFGPQIAVRKGDWKLVKGSGGGGTGVPTDGASIEGAQLYNLAEDIGEANDLAAKHPEKVKELAALWTGWNSQLVEPKWLPNRRAAAGRRQGQAATETGNAKGPWKSGDVLKGEDSPDVSGKAFTVSAEVDAAGATGGVIVAQGGAGQGFSLHLKDGKPTVSVRINRELHSVSSAEALPGGSHLVTAAIGSDGQVTITVDGRKTGEGKLPGPLAKKPGEGLTVGSDGQSPVGEYTGSDAFTGKVANVSVSLK